jgi:hypothetical protein
MDEAEAFFHRDGERFVPTVQGRGPWSPGHLHAGPPAALMGRALEGVMAERPPALLTRFTVDLLRPVPMAPLVARAEVVQAGRTVDRLAATLEADGILLARASAVAVREAPVDVAGPAPGERLPDPDGLPPFAFPFFAGAVGYHTAMDSRLARGAFGGPAAVWLRMRGPLVAGETPTPLQRVLVAADSPNGVAVVVDPRRITFVNADVTVHLHRLPRGEWIGLDATAAAERHGAGLAQAALHDLDGVFGRTLQSVVVARRPGA